MAKKPTTAVAVKDASATAVADTSMFETGPSGLENVTAKDLLIPRMTILQSLSPQINKKKPEYIEGAELGDFCDTGTGEVFKDTLTLLPCFYALIHLEWAPRDSGKGIVKNHGTDSAILAQTTRDDRNRNVLPNGNYVAETATFYCLNITAGGRRCFLPLSSTQLKAARRWLTLITNERLTRQDGSEYQPPIFYRSWDCTAVEQSNAQGDWAGWKMSPAKTVLELDPTPTHALLIEAREFYEQARDGLAIGDVQSMGSDHESNINDGTM